MFVERLLEKPSKQLRIRFTARNFEKQYEYTLLLDGMKEAIQALKKDCGMTPANTFRAPVKISAHQLSLWTDPFTISGLALQLHF